MKDDFFYLLFDCPLTDFEPLPKGQLHLPDVNHCINVRFQAEVYQESAKNVWSLGQTSTRSLNQKPSSSILTP